MRNTGSARQAGERLRRRLRVDGWKQWKRMEPRDVSRAPPRGIAAQDARKTAVAQMDRGPLRQQPARKSLCQTITASSGSEPHGSLGMFTRRTAGCENRMSGRCQGRGADTSHMPILNAMSLDANRSFKYLSRLRRDARDEFASVLREFYTSRWLRTQFHGPWRNSVSVWPGASIQFAPGMRPASRRRSPFAAVF